MYPNKYPGSCSSCGQRVGIGAGFIEKVGERWVTWCVDHKPTFIPRINLSLRGDRVVFAIQNLTSEAFNAYYAASKGTTYDPDTKTSYVLIDKLSILVSVVKTILDTPLLSGTLYPDAGTKQLLVKYEEHTRAAVQRFLARADSGLKLFPFQEVGAAWLSARAAALLSDDMGLGKTIQALAAHPDGAPLLIVGPAVAKGVWKREIRRWRKDLERVQVLEGRGSFLWPDGGEAVITNYDVLPTVDHPQLPLVGANTTLVLDEGHNLKNPNTARFQRVQLLVDAVRRAGGRVWMLTATPLLNRHKELWHILKLLDLHTEAYGTWGRFQRAFDYGGVPTPAAAQGLNSVMLRRTKSEVLKEIPPKTYDDRLVEVSLTREEDIEVRAAEEALLREGPNVDFNRISKARAILAKAKIPALNALISEYEEAGEPLVVFSCHRAPIDQLGDREGWALITGDTAPSQRTEIEDAFQAGKLRGIGATVRAGGVAITLTRAANAIFVDRDWTPALNGQAEDRLCRIGQTRPVNIVRLVAEDSLDQRVEEIITEKTIVIENSVEKASNLMGSIENFLSLGTAERLASRDEKPTRGLPPRVEHREPDAASGEKEGPTIWQSSCPF